MAAPPLPPATPRPASAVAFVLAGATAVVVLWFLYQIAVAVLLLFFAAVVALALSAVVDWFVRRGVPRRWAGILTLMLFFGTIVALIALMIPPLVEQVVALANNLPELIRQIEGEVGQLLASYPELQGFARFDVASSGDVVPAAATVVAGVGAFSLSILGGIALTIIFLSIIAYIVLDPVPLLRGYVGSLPIASRPAGMRAYRRAARAVIGWAKASLVVGALQAIAVFVFLTLMEVPGALVWAALAFFADFIPRIGGYIMAFPPTILALGQGPMTALWVIVFYIVSNEILGSIVAPKIRGATMAIHPVAIIFFTLAFALAFGLLGALVATPAAAFASAYYSEFYMKRALRRSEH